MTAHRKVQQIAKDTVAFARQQIHAGLTLPALRQMCEERMLALGADSFWYWDVGAFVFAGSETALSVSGRDYVTSERAIAENDIVTLDLSPQAADVWGDYARTLIVQNGAVVDSGSVTDPVWRRGLQTEQYLHAEMCRFVRPQTTFEELYVYMNGVICRCGFCNLDFLGNLGHSIALRKEDRIYIEKGNCTPLGEAAFFTFEPHIGMAGSPCGFKREDIYHFENGRAVAL